MLFLVMAVLIAASLVRRADSRLDEVVDSQRLAQARAAAWSGVQGAMAELADARDDLLAGGQPTLTDEWSLDEPDSGRRWIIRLRADSDGLLAQPEAARLDLNTATLEMLLATGVLRQSESEAIVAARAQAPFQSLEELLSIEGITLRRLYGSGEAASDDPSAFEPPSPGRARSPASGGGRFESSRRSRLRLNSDGAESTNPGDPALTGPGSAPRPTSPSPEAPGDSTRVPASPGASGELEEAQSEGNGIPLADVFTVHAFDPEVQAGAGPLADEHAGKRRVNLAQEWSDDLGRTVNQRFGDGADAAVRGLIQGGTKFDTPADVVGVLSQLNLQRETWGEILDGLCATEDPFTPGRVDILRAPVHVLQAIPGFGAAADQIIAERERLDDEQRRLITWPLLRDLVSVEEFTEAAGYLTCRSLQYRVIIEAGLASTGREAGRWSNDPVARTPRSSGRSDPSERTAALANPTGLEPEAELRYRVVLEAVIDVGSSRPRIASLRDITTREAELSAAARRPAPPALPKDDEDALPTDAKPLDGSLATGLPAPDDTPAPDSEADGAPESDGGARRSSSRLNPDSRLRSSARLRLGGSEPSGRLRRESPTDAPAPEGAGAEAGSRRATGSEPQARENGVPSRPAPVDRRIGRWTAGAKGGR